MRPQVLMPAQQIQKLQKYEPHHLHYSASACCRCGAGLAYPADLNIDGSWICSSILLGTADPALQHDDYPFMFYSIKSESQVTQNYKTTRPPEQGTLLLKSFVTCSCGHTWEKGPYLPSEENKEGLAGPCSECGNENGAGNSSRFEPGVVKPIERRVGRFLCTLSGEILPILVPSN